MPFEWAAQSPELSKVCHLFGFDDLIEPEAFCYQTISSLTQTGPQCGIVALVMCTAKPSELKIKEVLAYAKTVGLTNIGELFSVDSMFQLATKFIPHRKLELYTGSLNAERVVNFLMKGGTMIVPYDCDCNHSPCTRNGNKSHWAVVFGIATNRAQTYVFAKQGKSLRAQVWKLQELAASNQQLNEYPNEKSEDGFNFIMPQDGLAGKQGLSGRSVLIHPNNDTIYHSSKITPRVS